MKILMLFTSLRRWITTGLLAALLALPAALWAQPTADFQTVADEYDIPVELLQAISYINTRMVNRQGVSHNHSDLEHEQLVTQQEIEGSADYFGIMGLTEAQINQAAPLLGLSVEQIKTNDLNNIQAAALLLQEQVNQQFERQPTRLSLGDYYFVVAGFAQYDNKKLDLLFANEVFTVLRRGVQIWSEANESMGIQDSDYLLKPVERKRLMPFHWKAPPAAYQTALLTDPTVSSNLDSPVADTYTQSTHYSSRNGTTIKRIVLHTCEGSGSGCVNHLVKNEYSASAHYVVLESGSITQLVKEKDKAHHVKCCNSDSIGIEHAGFAHTNTWTAAQLQASYDLICDIAKRHKITVNETSVISHAKLDPSRRTDPGPYYPWDTMFSKVKACVGGQTAKKPDLRIAKFWWTPTYPLAGQAITFHAEVSNVDAATGANVGVAFYVNNQQVGFDAVTPMAANSKHEFIMREPWSTKTKGRYAVSALVDDTGKVAEANEQNNGANNTLNLATGDDGNCLAFTPMLPTLQADQDYRLKQTTLGRQILDIHYRQRQELQDLIGQYGSPELNQDYQKLEILLEQFNDFDRP